jgi:hypothetical protein
VHLKGDFFNERTPDDKHSEGGKMAKQLNMGDLFPEYTVSTVDGRTLHLPQDLAGEYSVLIFYRGSW